MKLFVFCLLLECFILLITPSPIIFHSSPNEEKRLIQTNSTRQLWVSQEELFYKYFSQNIKFMDITDYRDFYNVHTNEMLSKAKERTIPIRILSDHLAFLKSAAAKINGTRIMNDLEKYSSSFLNRFYKSQEGVKSADFLYNEIKSITDSAVPFLKSKGVSLNCSVKKEYHNNKWPQPSIIASISSTANNPEKDSKKNSPPIVIISAHLDSTSKFNIFPEFSKAPGADDNGSGTMTLLEVLRQYLLLLETTTLKTSVEFHWYAAEEAGLLGSQFIANSYTTSHHKHNKGKKAVVSDFHIDMDGYSAGSPMPTFAVVRDFTSPNLSSLIYDLANKLSDIPRVVYTECGYACSDHASWNKVGIPAAFAIESEFKDSNPYIHTNEDTPDKLSSEHMAGFGRVGLGYLIEMTLDNIPKTLSSNPSEMDTDVAIITSNDNIQELIEESYLLNAENRAEFNESEFKFNYDDFFYRD